jgi:MFS family permease
VVNESRQLDQVIALKPGLFAWWTRADRPAKTALIAAGLGWMLDAFDVMLYALVLGAIRRELGLDAATAGFLQSLTLVASAVGGFLFGVLADRWGRARALMLSVLLYSLFTALCGFAATALQLAVFRVFLGLGMGGEWASGAALVSETWSDEDRGKALGFMQSSWAIGYALAAAVNWFVQDIAGLGWRAVFFVGVLPALFTVWVQHRVKEPVVWQKARLQRERVSFRQAFGGTMLRITLAVTLMNACTMFAWWGLNTWVPSFLSTPASSGGPALGNAAMSGFVAAMQVGMWFGYVTFGYISDRMGRRCTYVAYLLLAALSVLAYSHVRRSWLLFALGPVVAFFGTGYFSGFGAVTAELYPTAVRATAQGFTYNIGRLASAAAPWLVGSLAERKGFPAALSLTATAFVLASVFWGFIPETGGRSVKHI